MSMDYAAARAFMVEGQVRANDVTDTGVIAAMTHLPRELFVPPQQRHLAYADVCVKLKPGRFLADPRTLSKLLQLAEVRPGDRVMDIGSGTGYSTAILCQLSGDVVTLEEEPDLAAIAQPLLARCTKLGDLFGVVGPHRLAHAARAPYDLIFVNGSVATPPAAWVQQLKEGGRMVVVTAQGPAGKGQIFIRHGAHASGRAAFDATVPVLPGFAPAKSFVF